MIQRTSSRLRSARRGSVLVEAALILPVLLLFLFGIFEYGRFLMTLQLINNAAREGARYAVTHTQDIVLDGQTYGSATSDVVSQVQACLVGTQLQNQTIEVFRSDNLGNNLGLWTDAASGERICVQVRGDFRVIANGLLFLPSSLPLQAQAVMRSEAN